MTADPQRRDESGEPVTPAPTVPEPAVPRPTVSECPLCGAVAQPNELRCPSCNMTLAGIDGRPGPFSRRVLWCWAAALVLIYLVVVAVVALIPA